MTLGTATDVDLIRLFVMSIDRSRSHNKHKMARLLSARARASAKATLRPFLRVVHILSTTTIYAGYASLRTMSRTTLRFRLHKMFGGVQFFVW